MFNSLGHLTLRAKNIHERMERRAMDGESALDKAALRLIDDLLTELSLAARPRHEQMSLLPKPPKPMITRSNAAAVVWAHTAIRESDVYAMFGIERSHPKYERGELIPVDEAVSIACANTNSLAEFWHVHLTAASKGS